ncbi:MAG: hypothetical protein WCP28_10515, partial [Actinomycetes bacterium]
MTFVDCISNAALAGCTTNPAASLRGAIGVAITPNGSHVYVGAQTAPGAVSTFQRIYSSTQWPVGCGAHPKT